MGVSSQMVRCDWGGEDYLDLMTVLDALLERPYADADRLGSGAIAMAAT